MRERERFDLAKVVAGCVDGYRIAYPEQRSCSTWPAGAIPVLGAPELIAQMLDKLVANAIEFATARSRIVVRLARTSPKREQRGYRSQNEGPPLPSAMHAAPVRFDGVGAQRARRTTMPHLGLGLYIVSVDRRVPGGSATASTRTASTGEAS